MEFRKPGYQGRNAPLESCPRLSQFNRLFLLVCQPAFSHALSHAPEAECGAAAEMAACGLGSGVPHAATRTAPTDTGPATYSASWCCPLQQACLHPCARGRESCAAAMAGSEQRVPSGACDTGDCARGARGTMHRPCTVQQTESQRGCAEGCAVSAQSAAAASTRAMHRARSPPAAAG